MEQNHNEGGDDLPPLPEQREQLRINSIVIPADTEEPLRQHQLGAASLDEHQELVGGLIQAIALEQPPARMYINEEGKMHGLPVNRRATMLLWVHNRAFRYQDFIVGDAFLVGHTGRRGLDTDVSDEFVERLFTARQFHVEVLMRGDLKWQERGIRFDQWTTAYHYALGIGMGGERARQLEDVRVVPEL